MLNHFFQNSDIIPFCSGWLLPYFVMFDFTHTFIIVILKYFCFYFILFYWIISVINVLNFFAFTMLWKKWGMILHWVEKCWKNFQLWKCLDVICFNILIREDNFWDAVLKGKVSLFNLRLCWLEKELNYSKGLFLCLILGYTFSEIPIANVECFHCRPWNLWFCLFSTVLPLLCLTSFSLYPVPLTNHQMS